jgi:hypothetical protein
MPYSDPNKRREPRKKSYPRNVTTSRGQRTTIEELHTTIEELQDVIEEQRRAIEERQFLLELGPCRDTWRRKMVKINAHLQPLFDRARYFYEIRLVLNELVATFEEQQRRIRAAQITLLLAEMKASHVSWNHKMNHQLRPRFEFPGHINKMSVVHTEMMSCWFGRPLWKPGKHIRVIQRF